MNFQWKANYLSNVIFVNFLQHYYHLDVESTDKRRNSTTSPNPPSSPDGGVIRKKRKVTGTEIKCTIYEIFNINMKNEYEEYLFKFYNDMKFNKNSLKNVDVSKKGLKNENEKSM